jgi:hypothetical protein
MLVSQGYALEDLNMQAFGGAFVFFTGLLCLLYGADFYHKKIIDRFQLGTGLFCLVGSIAYLANISSLLYYYDNYTRVLYFLSVVIIGFITTSFTKTGFIGVVSDDQKAVKIASIKLLFLSIIALFWNVYLPYPWTRTIFSFVLPLYVLEWARHRWCRHITGEKADQWKMWKFKWKY